MPFSDTYRDSLLGVIQSDITHVALVSNDDSITDTTNITTLNEKGRVVPTITQTGNKLVIQSTFTASDGNCVKTTISGNIGSNYFDVTSATGLTIGDRILVNGVKYKISNVSGSTITTSVNLNPVPTVGMEVKEFISQIHLVKDGTGSANSGSTAFVNSYNVYKENPQIKKQVSYITVNASARVQNFSYSSLSEYLLYSSNESGQYQMYIIKPDGTGKTNISNDNTKEDREPQYNSTLDAFVFQRKIGSYYQICKKDRVSGTVTQLTSASAHSYVPAISPDGTKISFVRGTKVYIINASDGSAIVDFTPSVYPFSTNRCNFNSTSDKVLVVETTFPNYQGNLYNMSGVKDPGSVLTPLGLQFPAYSKDYTKLIMRAFITGVNQIYKANVDGSSLTQMTTSGIQKQQCAYSPDGLSFAYIENHTGAIKKALVSTPDTATQIVSSSYTNDFGDWLNIRET